MRTHCRNFMPLFYYYRIRFFLLLYTKFRQSIYYLLIIKGKKKSNMSKIAFNYMRQGRRERVRYYFWPPYPNNVYGEIKELCNLLSWLFIYSAYKLYYFIKMAIIFPNPIWNDFSFCIYLRKIISFKKILFHIFNYI